MNRHCYLFLIFLVFLLSFSQYIYTQDYTISGYVEKYLWENPPVENIVINTNNNSGTNTPPYADFTYTKEYNSYGFCYPNIELWLDASGCYDVEDSGDSLQVRWTIIYSDYGGDFTISTSWTTDRYYNRHADYFPYHVKLEVKDTGGLISTKEKDLSVIINTDLKITPSEPLEFGYVNIGNYVDKTVRISNGFFPYYPDCKVTIKNITSTNSQFEVIGENNFSLDRREYRDVTVRFRPISAGYQYGILNIQSKLGYDFINSYEMNGYGTLPLPDMQCNPTSLAINPTTVQDGNTFEISGIIENDSDGSTGDDFQVNVFICLDKNLLDFQSSCFVGQFSVSALDSGSNSNFNETVTIPESVSPGVYYAWVSIDPNNAVEETDETNNQQFCNTELVVGSTGNAQENTRVITQYNMRQNYPNPLNPGTRIQYELSKLSHVILGIYNLMGQEVVRLVDEVKDMGIYSVDWDGRDSQGVYLPSGVYIYHIKAGEFIESKKLILNR